MSLEGWLTVVTRIYFGAGAVAAFATAVTVVAGLAQYRIGGILTDMKDRAFAEFRISSDKQIAELQRSAAEANKSAEREKLERIRIEERLAPRSLAGERLQKFVQDLASLKGTNFGVVISGGTPESTRIANAIASALIAAGWTRTGTESVSHGIAVEGVLVDAQDTGDKAARKLVDALNMANVRAAFQADVYRLIQGTAGMKLGGVGAASVIILIGTKP